MRCKLLILGTVLIAAIPALASAAPVARAGQAAAPAAQASPSVQPAPPERLDPNVFRCGPILAKDPATRERIKGLYKEQWDLQQTTLARLKDLGARAETESDQDARAELNRQGVQLKRDLLQRNMELGLEIARLNEDVPRVAEYEKALDQLQHPEKYAPAVKPDPELQARRARERGIVK